MELILAIDAGGTRTRCIAVDRIGRVAGEGLAGASNHLHVPMEAAAASLRTAAAAALAAAGAATRDVVLVSAGLAGVDYDGTGAGDAAAMLRSIGVERSVVYGDMVIAHRGALAGAAGVVALAGTGSSVLGIAADGTAIKAGGWGPLYGDHGSAYQLGRLGLVASAEAHDGSGPWTSLVERLTTALGVSAFPDTVTRLYSDLIGQQDVAALAPAVNACAEEGDEVAAAICRQAGADLARGVLAVIRRLPAESARQWAKGEEQTAAGSAAPVRVSYQGAVLARSRQVRDAFLRALRAGAPDVAVSAPRFEPIAGAVLLGAREAGWHLPIEALEVLRGV